MDNFAPNSLELAISIAVQAHQGQTDKQNQPYILHPLRVMHRVWAKVGLKPDHMIVAILHDVVEDSEEWSLWRLAELGFDPHIVSAVDAVTRREKERYLDFVRRAHRHPIGSIVKLEDVNDNRERVPEKFDARWWQKLQVKYSVAVATLTDHHVWLEMNKDLIAGLEAA